MSDGVPIPTCDVLESESKAVAGRLQPRCSVDEKDRVVDEMFLTKFREEHLGECLCSRREQADVEQAVRCGIDGSVQPVSLVIELDHSFVKRNVIRVSTIEWL